MTGADGLRDALRLFRAQTAAVEGAGFPIAAWIGGAPLWTLPLFALLGLLSHFGGFGENGISDLRYDRLDPAKADHPLVAGRMAVPRAFALVYGCQAAGVVMFLALLQFATGLAVLPLAAFVGYILLGHVYNFMGKWWKPGAVIEIGGAFALAFLAMATAWTGRADAAVVAVAAYAFVFTAFQIGVAGELKELAQSNERNLLRRLGTTVGPLMGPQLAGLIEDAVRGGAVVVVSKRAAVGDFLFTGRRTWAFAFGLSWAKATALGVVGFLLLGWWGVAVAVVSYAVFMLYTVVLLRPGPFDRPRRVRIMGLGEAGSYLLLVFALAPVLWPWLWVAFIVLPVLWFTMLNRTLWTGSGSAWAPGV